VSTTFRSLQVRNFRVYFGGQLISQVGNWLTLVTQVLLVYEITGSGTAAGLLTACQFGPVLLFGAWAGLIADRSDKRKLLLVVQAIAMCQSFVLAAVAFLPSPPLWPFYAIAIVGGFLTAFDSPTRRSFVGELVPEDHLQNAVSLNSILMTGARVVGPSVAGVLIVTTGYGWCFLVDGVSYLAVMWSLLRIDTSQVRAAPVAPRGKGQVRAGLRYARDIPELWISLTMMTVLGALAYNFSVIFPLFITESLSSTKLVFTVFFSVVSVGSVLGGLLAARRSWIGLRDVSRAAVAFGVSMLLMALSPNLAVAFPLGLAIGLTSLLFVTTSAAMVQMRTEPSMRGRVLALQSTVLVGSTPIGGPLVGLICDVFGPRYGILLGAAAALGGGFWGLARLRATEVAPTNDLATVA
jgi:MFS family permease